MESESDAVLMGRIANGESDPVAILIDRYKKSLMSFLDRTSPGAAADLFQETWIRVVRSAGRYDPTFRFTRWLFGIAWNLTRDEWTRKQKDSENTAGEPGNRGTTDSVETALIRDERARRIRVLIEALPPQQAEAVFLRYFEDLSEREMAERLGVPAGTVKSRLHHALRRLAPALKENLP